MRLDQLLVDRGLAESKTRAQAYIIEGRVSLEGRPLSKPGVKVPVDAPLVFVDSQDEYVSRGAFKLKAALDHFGINPEGLRVLDVGISTGGFTDLLLRRGAARVFGVDVGKGVVAWRLRNDRRVTLFEGCNFRYFDPALLETPVDLAVMDASFISARLLLPVIRRCVRQGAIVLPLVKPQFELGQEKVGKGGVVRDEALRLEAVEAVSKSSIELGFQVLGHVQTGVPGPAGNMEYFLHLLA